MNWLTILREAVEASSITAVADKLGISRTTVSLVLADKYPAKPDKIAQKVMDVFARITCPHTGVEITCAECRQISSRTAPTSSPQAMRQWRACQGCAHKGGKS